MSTKWWVNQKLFLIIFYFLFPLKIQQTAKHNNFLYIRKIKRKSNLQSNTKPLPNLHLAVQREHITLKRTYFRALFWRNCSIFETGKGELEMELLTVLNNNNITKNMLKLRSLFSLALYK